MRGTHGRKRDEYIERRNKTWSERERDGGVLIREATVMPRPTTTTLPPPNQLHIFTTIRKTIRHINEVKKEEVDEYIFYRLKFMTTSRIKKDAEESYIKLQNLAYKISRFDFFS